MSVCVVTCTGARQELFALCRRWVESQSVRPDLWIVTTDTGEKMTDLPDYAAHFDVKPGGPDGALRFALSIAPVGHHVVVMEDDDYYAPKHIEKCLAMIAEGAEVTTGDVAMRWHLPERKWSGEHRPDSLIQGTIGISAKCVQRYASIIGNWKEHQDDFREIRYPGWSTIGIKGVGYGLPGRPGFTRSHIPGHRKVVSLFPDPDLSVFRRYLGDAADSYTGLLDPRWPRQDREH